MTDRVEEILESGEYTDSQGQKWERLDSGVYTQWSVENDWPYLEHSQMRRLIEGDHD